MEEEGVEGGIFQLRSDLGTLATELCKQARVCGAAVQLRDDDMCSFHSCVAKQKEKPRPKTRPNLNWGLANLFLFFLFTITLECNRRRRVERDSPPSFWKENSSGAVVAFSTLSIPSSQNTCVSDNDLFFFSIEFQGDGLYWLLNDEYDDTNHIYYYTPFI